MSVDNFVQCRVVTPLSASSVQVVLLDAEPPYQLPPADGGTLVLCDSVGRPSFLEVISYTSRNGLVLYGVVRGQEGTTARDWSGATYAYQSLTANQYETDLANKVDKVTGQSLMLDTERIKLSGIAAGAQVNVSTNLSQGTRTATGLPLTSSTGAGTTLPIATTTLAGLMSAADK